MFNKMATMMKHRGDSALQTKAGVLDHFHALCSYILSFYYADKLNRTTIRESTITWKTLFPFCENLMRNLEANDMTELRPLCVRLMGLIRLYLHRRLKTSLPSPPSKEDTVGMKKYLDMCHSVFREEIKGFEYVVSSEKLCGFIGLKKSFPTSFKKICVEGDFSEAVFLGEEETSLPPHIPFLPSSTIHLSSLSARHILNEYVSNHSIPFSPLMEPGDFM